MKDTSYSVISRQILTEEINVDFFYSLMFNIGIDLKNVSTNAIDFYGQHKEISCEHFECSLLAPFCPEYVKLNFTFIPQI